MLQPVYLLISRITSSAEKLESFGDFYSNWTPGNDWKMPWIDQLGLHKAEHSAWLDGVMLPAIPELASLWETILTTGDENIPANWFEASAFAQFLVKLRSHLGKVPDDATPVLRVLVHFGNTVSHVKKFYKPRLLQYLEHHNLAGSVEIFPYSTGENFDGILLRGSEFNTRQGEAELIQSLDAEIGRLLEHSFFQEINQEMEEKVKKRFLKLVSDKASPSDLKKILNRIEQRHKRKIN